MACLAKYSLALDSSASSMCFSRSLFVGTFLTNFLRACHKTALIFISCLILHQLNTKPNTIKSHKIQRNNLLHLQHFLSCNKANIKHSYKSQLYTLVLSIVWNHLAETNFHFLLGNHFVNCKSLISLLLFASLFIYFGNYL